MGLPSPVVSSEAQIGLATPLSPESPIDPRQQEPPHMIATAIGEPPRSHHSSRSSASRHTSPSAPSFGSRSRRSSSGTGSSAHRRLSNDVPLPSAKHDPRDSETFDSTAAQTRRIVALEAELALAKKSATIVEDLRRQLAAEQAKRREEEDHLLREAKNDLERARREAEEEVRTLRSLIEKERVEREKRMVEMEREVVAATKARADKERRVSELEVQLAKARSDGEEWQKKLSTIKAALGLA